MPQVRSRGSVLCSAIRGMRVQSILPLLPRLRGWRGRRPEHLLGLPLHSKLDKQDQGRSMPPGQALGCCDRQRRGDCTYWKVAQMCKAHSLILTPEKDVLMDIQWVCPGWGGTSKGTCETCRLRALRGTKLNTANEHPAALEEKKSRQRGPKNSHSKWRNLGKDLVKRRTSRIMSIF